MRSLLLAPYYFKWHYGRALKGLADISANCIWFLWHFFSIAVLSRTLFQPWQRLQEKPEKRFDVNAFLSSITINIVMRFVGFFIRIIFILIGLVSIVAALVFEGVVFLVWLAMPLVVVFMIVFGLVLIFKPA